jgi:transcriptional regulator with XRE-family HTH domain
VFERGWRAELARHRHAVGLTQTQLALQAGVSGAAIKAYEQGVRDPPRSVVVSILDALKVDRGTRTRILNQAGFASDSDVLSPSRDPDYYFSLEEALAEAETHPWPIAVQSELMEVLGANQLMQRIWGVDLERELHNPVERNVLSVISLPRFEDRLLNWDEVCEVALSVVKGHHLGAETAPEGSSAYFTAVMQHFMTGVPAYVTRLAEIWERTESIPWKVRWWCPVEWRDPDVGLMRFHALFTTASEHDGMAFMDWIPVDGQTSRAMEGLRAELKGHGHA